MNRVLILHYHEIWLKGGNKNYFLSRLRAAVKLSVADLPVRSLESISERLVLTPEDEGAIPVLLERLRRVFGLAYIALARKVASPLADLAPAACAMMAENPPRNFAVRAKIADSAYGMNSMGLERALGRAILDDLRSRDPSIQVKLNDPEVTCWVEIVPGKAFLYRERVEGPGGLPAVTGGRLVTLLSGGFDSAVAAYKMMRRGCHVIFAHYFGPPSGGRNSSRGVAEEIVRTLTPYQFTSRLYLLPFDAVQRQIVAGAHESFRLLLYRRMMARIAREIAKVEKGMGLVTGDSVSQVASQTLHNLAAIDHGLDLPVYRPLAGDDKAEILKLARRIGTYRISCEPFEDCCPRFMPRAPAIFAHPEQLDRAEAGLDIEKLVGMGLEGASAVDFKFECGAVTAHEALPPRFQNFLARRKGVAGQAAAPGEASARP
ncbi:MAG: tRNA 4-thiouridine(8) synthase ThiI [Acidobacteriia bacterium]|nr:tRNA 4-thiouridine(8) synthase ThiI [Terriglobia bacterium]